MPKRTLKQRLKTRNIKAANAQIKGIRASKSSRVMKRAATLRKNGMSPSAALKAAWKSVG